LIVIYEQRRQNFNVDYVILWWDLWCYGFYTNKVYNQEFMKHPMWAGKNMSLEFIMRKINQVHEELMWEVVDNHGGPNELDARLRDSKWLDYLYRLADKRVRELYDLDVFAVDKEQ